MLASESFAARGDAMNATGQRTHVTTAAKEKRRHKKTIRTMPSILAVVQLPAEHQKPIR